MNKPKISVIVPVYNAESTLQECLDSLLKQTFDSYEIIAVNDGSTDNSGEILKQYSKQDRRVIVLSQDNAGVSAARNKGLDIAKGEWITFCDSDDFVDEDWLKDFHDNIFDNDIVSQGMRCYHSDGKIEERFIEKISGNKEELTNYVLRLYRPTPPPCLWDLVGWSVLKLYKKDIIDVHNVRFDEKSHFREDVLFFTTYILYVDKWQSIPNMNYNYKVPDSSKIYRTESVPGYTLMKIFRNIDCIFPGQYYPEIVAQTYLKLVKDVIITKIHNKMVPTNHDTQVYSKVLASTKSNEKSIISYLLILSSKSMFARMLIRLIHKLS